MTDRTKKEREALFVSGFIQTFNVLRFTNDWVVTVPGAIAACA